MILTDLHTHTCYCDGKNTPEEMVMSAVKKGLAVLGFSGHSYSPFDLQCCMHREDELKYRKQIEELKAKYSGEIEIRCGLEQDYYSPAPDYKYDYLIGSVHYLLTDGEYFSVDESAPLLRNAVADHFGGDPYAMAELYFNTVADLPNKFDIDIIGHFDLITKFIDIDPLFDINNKRYIEAWKKSADTLLKYDIPFEINTGAISRGYRTSPYPDENIINYIKAAGGRFILSSDSHSRDTLLYDFEKYEYLI